MVVECTAPPELFHIPPVFADANFDQQRNPQGMNIFHFVLYKLTNGLDFVFGNFEDKFVVDLQRHARFQSARLKLAIDADHGELDQVGGGSLQRRVDGGALGESAKIRVLAVDVGDGAHTSEEREDFARRDVPARACCR